MENTVNSRVLLLKTHLGLGNNEFAIKANISTTTVWNIQNGGEINPKTIRNISEALNVNKEWLLTGKGKMFNDPKETILAMVENPYKDALVAELKQQNERLTKQNEWFQSLINQLTAGLKPNFLKGTWLAALNKGVQVSRARS